LQAYNIDDDEMYMKLISSISPYRLIISCHTNVSCWFLFCLFFSLFISRFFASCRCRIVVVDGCGGSYHDSFVCNI
ncbi:hypothetical protein DERP_005806, partial [Dermatophagoides pteronyssinus]